MEASCRVCGHGESEGIYGGLLRCVGCGFVYALPPNGDDNLASLYGREYFYGDEYADYVGDKKVIQRNLGRWLRTVRRYVKDGTLVEVGCAYGFFLELAQREFRVVGYDVSQEAVQYANDVVGAPARCANFLEDDGLAEGSVDAVAMWDVIEHVDEPDRFVARSAQILRPGGHLFLTTGDIDAWLPRRQGPRWRLIHPPTHLQYFSRRTMVHLLDRMGFEVVRVMYPAYWRSIKQMLHGFFVFGNPNGPSIVHRVLSRVLPGGLGIPLNTFDIMLVVASKRSESRAVDSPGDVGKLWGR